MKKYLFILIIGLVSNAASSQVPEQYIGVAGNRVVTRGQAKDDSLTILSSRDTTVSARVFGGLLYRLSDQFPYYFNGTRFYRFASKDYADSVSAIVVTTANNGLTKSGANIQLGQTVGAVGNPANLLSNREIPLNGFNISFTGAGSMGLGVAAAAANKLTVRGTPSRFSSIQIDSQSVFSGNPAGLSLYARQAVMAPARYTAGILEYSFPTVTQPGWYAYLGVQSWAYLFGATPQQPGNAGVKFQNYMTAFSGGQVYDNDNTTLQSMMGYFSSLNNQHGTITNSYDYYASDLNSVMATTNNDTVANHYAFYAEGFDYAVGNTKNYGVYIDGPQRNYMEGKLWIGSKTDTANKLNVTGTVKITDTLKLTGLLTKTDTTANKPLAVDASGNTFRMSTWPVGTPALAATQIAFGDNFNLLTSNVHWRYVDSVKAALSKKFYASNYVRAGDSTYNSKPTLTSIFFGNSITAGAISPIYMRPSTRISNGLNNIELNLGIGGTRMVQVSPGDSAMEERTFLIPTYNASVYGYLFFAYGTNDWRTASIDSAEYRTVYNTVIDDAQSKGWPNNRIVIIVPGYSIHATPSVQPRNLEFVFITKDLASKQGVKYVDAYTAMWNNGGANCLALPDSTHLNELGAEAWAIAALDTLGAKNAGMRVNGSLYARAISMKQYGNRTPLILGYDSAGNQYFELKGWNGNGSFNANIAIGTNALDSNTTGINNYVFGQAAMRRNTTGSGNTAMGSLTLNSNVAGSNNIAIGTSALTNSNADRNIAIGNFSLSANTTGTKNVTVGYSALQLNTTGSNNIGIGDGSLGANTTANNNVAIGASSLPVTTTGGDNTAIGTNALFSNIGGSSNTAIGYNSLFTASAGVANSTLGKNALRFTTGSLNTAVGFEALTTATTSSRNTGVGVSALKLTTTGGNNTAIGYAAADSNTVGIGNTAIGYESAFNWQTGDSNVNIGLHAGLNMRVGSNNVNIGSYLWPTNTTANKRLTIADGTGALWLYGDSIQNLGVGTVIPTEKLDVNGKIRIRTMDNGDNDDSVLVSVNNVPAKVDRSTIGIVRGTMSGDGSFTIAENIGLQRLIDITANRTVTMPTPTEGKTLVIWNANTGAFAWNISGSVVDAAGTTLTTFLNDTTYTLMGTGSEWLILAVH